jgi:DNA-binding LacI/PurR family transcriptional regulator
MSRRGVAVSARRKTRSSRPVSAAATTKDIARALNLSVTTVSRALRGKPGMAPRVRERILETAARMGYVRNPAGAALSTGKLLSIVYVIAEPASKFLGVTQMEVLKGLVDEVSATHNVTVLAEEQLRAQGVSLFGLHRVLQADGAVVFLEHDVKIDPKEKTPPYPLVVVNRMVKGLKADFVLSDDRGGAYDATKHLLDLGHRKILHLSSARDHFTLGKRLEGYRQALRDAGVPFRSELVQQVSEISQVGGLEAIRQLREKGIKFTGVFCASDALAPGVVAGLREQGLRVPEDVAVVGFDDLLFAQILDPPLSTIRKPRYQMGRDAGRLLISRISGDLRSSRITKSLPTKLIVRASSGGSVRNRS